jgi:methylenetetrahydrofolate reductase (NADPH)
MFGCKDCGDCSLPDIGYLCPESQCAKNQRNGPCGGTRDGKCEVYDFECIWSRAYDRMKYEGCEQNLLAHAPVIQDETLRGTSSWANALLGRDHTSKRSDPLQTCGASPAPEPRLAAGPKVCRISNNENDSASQEPVENTDVHRASPDVHSADVPGPRGARAKSAAV